MRNHPYDKLKDHKYEKGIFKSPINESVKFYRLLSNLIFYT